MKYEKQFRIAHPETVGETDSHFDLSNYADWLEKKYDEAIQQRDELKEALIEIAECKGVYSMDRLEHATNVIKEAKAIAEAAIKKTER